MKIFFNLASISIILIGVLSCSSEPKETVEKKPINQPVKVEPKDFYKFKHLLPESDYAYQIEISEIDFKVHKNAFTTKKEKYDAPVNIDGLSFNLSFKMSNPYNKPMQVPFPDYFYITAKEFDGLEEFIYSKSCRCYINNQTEIKNSKGKEIYDFTLANPDKNSAYRRVIDFKPNETMEFRISFSEPFPSFIKEVTFVGFNEHLSKQIDYSVYEKMSESERDANKTAEHALIIDISSKKIINRTKFMR